MHRLLLLLLVPQGQLVCASGAKSEHNDQGMLVTTRVVVLQAARQLRRMAETQARIMAAAVNGEAERLTARGKADNQVRAEGHGDD